MNHAATKIITLFLLMAQVACGMARGSMLCIPVHGCEKHEPRSDGPEEEIARCQSHHGHTHGHVHGPALALIHEHDDCGCHIHATAPDDPQLPRIDGPDLRVALAPAWMTGARVDFRAPLRRPSGGLNPDRSSLDHARALRATRILV